MYDCGERDPLHVYEFRIREGQINMQGLLAVLYLIARGNTITLYVLGLYYRLIYLYMPYLLQATRPLARQQEGHLLEAWQQPATAHFWSSVS